MQRQLPPIESIFPHIHRFPQHNEATNFYGWMTERDRNWLLNFQLQQVKTDNPYYDDYYFINNEFAKNDEDEKGFKDPSVVNSLNRNVWVQQR